MNAVKAYPLQWPTGWRRTAAEQRERGKFFKATRSYSADQQNSWRTQRELTIAEATKRVLDQLRMFGVLEDDAVISTNLRLRLDGMPQSGQRQPEDSGVAVYWVRAGEAPRCMAADRYEKVEHNLAAISATLEAMRAIERHGSAEILDRAFTGFAALPAPITGQKPWRQVLGVGPEERDPEAIRNYYRVRRGETHPDREGGNEMEFLAVQAAYEQAARELGFTP